MASFCMPCMAAVNMDLGGLSEASDDGKRLAEETIALCNTTQQKSRSVINFAEDTETTLRDLDGVNPSKFMKVLELLDDDKRKAMLSTVTGMDDLAIECSAKARGMQDAMQRGVDSMPDFIKDQANEEGDADRGPEEDIPDFEADITDLQECTKSLQSMNLFTAATTGTRAFEGLVNKSGVCQTVFEYIKNLSITVARISQGLQFDSCCAQLQGGLGTLKEMMKCLRLTNIIQTLADTGRRLIDAFVDLVKVAWEKFGHFVDEFNAAKKLQHWVGGLTPLGSKAGKFAEGAGGLIKNAGNFMNKIGIG